ncbi:phosphoglucomutase [Marivirga tractuosa]|uniref:Phosphoglucomutase/phosphomannomutase alpha/beta/alpha domain I n=1 Tax=Marivirga tractuosa (strain ATCC 23168 / DSM 4126 / NBRC 15989 / NCIMB 1408 / VKM B-1430 / H-43) TaxID=643867 RepID=E4TS16_MARTH|nr:phospho-sugar mutase [Marivirga tractuosa]ADR20767.1 phosphoglucomutase/phosphomannomutase alpha/beta/alpha domain I [Marivirga tractuosa DSM 4126]BDD14782.1 phosphoglucomutase [Marivirga tractuosa]
MTSQEKAQQWLESKSVDEATKQQIKELQENNKEEFEESFYKDLEFGTGGLRGIMGVGSNRMNKYTLGMATQGLSNYLNKTFKEQGVSVAIAHDCRNNAEEFARVVADVFTANNIKVFFFDSLRPTPELSFAIRHLGCKSGVVLTASHNPKEYNGYKAYWTDGAQMVAPHDLNVMNEVQSITSIDEVHFEGKETLIESIGEDIDEAYLDEVKKISLFPDATEADKSINIVFSSIHGTGITLVPKALEMYGFKNVHIVEDQAEPNGNFPTVVYPNPEEKEAMSMALAKGKEVDADIVMATDPDADRVGIAIKNARNEFELLNGNQTGSLLIYYLLSRWSELGKLDGNQYIVKTIVTTELFKNIADAYQVESYDTLTGFKNIAAVIRELEGKKTFIGGGEESYGYMISDYVRDKDAIASVAMIAEMTAYVKSQGKTLYEYLIEMYLKFGFYREDLVSITKKGKSGSEEIKAMMTRFREEPPKKLAGTKVVEVRDYQKSTILDMESGKKSRLDFPSSNVLQFFLEDGSKISARPSGTEPKIKFYVSVKGKLRSKESFEADFSELGDIIKSYLDGLDL